MFVIVFPHRDDLVSYYGWNGNQYLQTVCSSWIVLFDSLAAAQIQLESLRWTTRRWLGIDNAYIKECP